MLKEITVLSLKKANEPGWLDFYNFLHWHFWFPIVSASYTIDPPETNLCFISNWSIFRMPLRIFAMSP